MHPGFFFESSRLAKVRSLNFSGSWKTHGEKTMHTNTTALAVCVDEAARRAGVGRGYLYQQIREGHLRARKTGRRTLIALVDLAAWLEALPTFAAESIDQ